MKKATTITPNPQEEEKDAIRRLASEVFIAAAASSLVKHAAEALAPHGILVMPLKGVLLQKLVYGDEQFRRITDVDLLVPQDRFFEAFAVLKSDGFSEVHWQPGRWQATMIRASGPRLGIDLHRRLTRTDRSGLKPTDLFRRGSVDTELFGTPVVIPCAEDLFAHLLLHATLHWLSRGNVHRPSDFEAVAARLTLDVSACAGHLERHGLIAHALFMLPLIAREGRGPFVERLLQHLPRSRSETARAWLARKITARFDVGHPGRRLAGLALAPSLTAALISAARDRTRIGTVSADRSG